MWKTSVALEIRIAMKSTDSGVAPRADHGGGSLQRSGGVQSLIRALTILDTLAENEDGLSLTVLSKAVALPPSSVHRLLTTLQRKRFVRFETGTMLWRIGVQAFVVGSAFARSREVSPLAMPFMRQLMERTGETVNLYVHNGGEAVCIAQVQSRQAVRAISRPGGGVPLQKSAAGKAMLAKMSKSEVDEILSKHSGPDANRTVRSGSSKFHAELGMIRSRGFAFDDEQVAAGLRCIAVSILDEHGMAHAAISIAGPTTRLVDHRIPRLAEMVLATGDAVTREFGGPNRLPKIRVLARS